MDESIRRDWNRDPDESLPTSAEGEFMLSAQGTNRQVALLAAATLYSGAGHRLRGEVKDTAADFEKWLDEADG